MEVNVMSKFFYAKLAIINLKRNSKTYIPYTLTCIGTIIMFYNMCSLTYHETTGNGSVASMMQVGMIVTGIFSIIFLFYTNSFLVKRRKNLDYLIFWEWKRNILVESCFGKPLI